MSNVQEKPYTLEVLLPRAPWTDFSVVIQYCIVNQLLSIALSGSQANISVSAFKVNLL